MDHCLTNQPEIIVNHYKCDFSHSDHDAIFMDFETGAAKKNPNQMLKSRDFRKLRANPSRFNQELDKIDWRQLDEQDDLDSMVDFWKKSTTSVLNILAPEGVRKVSKKKVKLLPQHVRDAQRKCNKMKKDLMMHEKGEKPFNCSQCDKRLCKGCAAVMKEESCFTCPKCCKNFSCLSDLKKHEMHITEPSICAGCNCAPNTSNQLKEHETIRANDEPFSCAHCDKTFCNKADKNEVRAYRKQKNFTNRLINKVIQDHKEIKINEKSSMNDCYKACEEVLRPEKLAKNKMQLIKDGETIENPKELVDVLNHFFKNKPEKLAADVKIHPGTDPLEKLREKMKSKKLSFGLQTVSVNHVKNIIRKLKPKKSCGFDELSSELLKMGADVLSEPLTKIINKSIEDGRFPEDWKVAKVCPLHKKR